MSASERRYTIVTVSAPSRLETVATSIAVLPAPITTTLRADVHSAKRPRMRLEDEVERLPDAFEVFAFDRKRQRSPQADAQEYGVELGRACACISGAVTAMLELDVDADPANHLDLGKGEFG